MYYSNMDEREMKPQQEAETAAVRDFLTRFGMALDAGAEYTIALYSQERIVATGSLAGENLCSIAVEPEFRGEGLAARLVTLLIQEAARRGRYRYLISADSDTANLFGSLGFREIGRTQTGNILLAMGLTI